MRPTQNWKALHLSHVPALRLNVLIAQVGPFQAVVSESVATVRSLLLEALVACAQPPSASEESLYNKAVLPAKQAHSPLSFFAAGVEQLLHSRTMPQKQRPHPRRQQPSNLLLASLRPLGSGSTYLFRLLSMLVH